MKEDKGFVPYEVEMGRRLLALRGERSQEEVSQDLGIRRETVKQWENAERHIKAVDLYKLSEYYGVSVDFLLGITDQPSTSADIHTAQKTLGLSNEAINNLLVIKDRLSADSGVLDLLNSILGASKLVEVMALLSVERNRLAKAVDAAQLMLEQERNTDTLFRVHELQEQVEFIQFKASRLLMELMSDAMDAEAFGLVRDNVIHGRNDTETGGNDGENDSE